LLSRASRDPNSDFAGLTIVGAPLGDETAQHLTPELVASVREVITSLLSDTAVAATDIRIQSGRTYLL